MKIFECKVALFNKDREETLGMQVEEIWANFIFDLADVICIREALDKNENIDKDSCVIYISDSSFWVNMSYEEIKVLWSRHKQEKNQSLIP